MLKEILIFAALSSSAIFCNAQKLSKTAQELEKQGYVNIHTLDKTIVVDLMYSRADNFTGKVLYTDLKEAYLEKEAAKALMKAQKILHQKYPDYNLKVCDAARPMHIQAQMWKVVENTNKQRYVSNPAHGGGLHNFGLAVDITVVDKNGMELDMGTCVDHLGKEAHVSTEQQMIQQKILTKQQVANRRILRNAMTAAGFHVLNSEWWHFNFKTRAQCKALKYKVIP